MLNHKKPFYAENAELDWEKNGFYRDLPAGWSNKGIVRREKIKSSASIPLTAGSEPVGVLFVNYRKPVVFSSNLKEAIDDFASAAALAIQNARHYSSSIEHLKNVKTLNEIGRELSTNTTLALDDIINMVYRQAKKVLDLTNFYVALYDKETDSYSFPIHSDQYDDLNEIDMSQMKDSLTEFVRIEKKAYRITKTIHSKLKQNSNIDLIGKDSAVWLGAPLIVENDVIGVLVVQNYDNEFAFSEHHLEVLSTIASQASIAISNSRLVKELQSQIQEQKILYEISQELISKTLNAKVVLESIIRHAVELTGAEGGSILTYDTRIGKLKVVVVYELNELLGQYLDINQSMSGIVFQSGKPLITNDYQNEKYRSEIFKDSSLGLNLGSIIQVPLKWKNEIIGVLAISSSKGISHKFTSANVKLLERFSGMASIAMGLVRELTFRQSLLDKSPDAIIAVDAKGRITQVNKVAVELLGYQSKHNLLGKRVDEHVYWNKITEAKRIYNILEKEGKTVRIETNVQESTGNRIPILLTASILDVTPKN